MFKPFNELINCVMSKYEIGMNYNNYQQALKFSSPLPIRGRAYVVTLKYSNDD